MPMSEPFGGEEIERDALLAAIIAGERGLDDPAVQGLLEREPDLRTELVALRGLDARLHAAAAPWRESARDDDARLVQASVQRARRQPFTRRPLLWLAVAAGIAAVAAWAWHETGTDRPQQFLGSEIAFDTALRPVAAGGALRWHGTVLPRGGFYRVGVYAAEAAAEPVWRSERLTDAALDVSSAMLAAWPTTFWLEVEACTLDGRATARSARCAAGK